MNKFYVILMDWNGREISKSRGYETRQEARETRNIMKTDENEDGLVIVRE